MEDLGAQQPAGIRCGNAVAGAEATENGKLPLVPSTMVGSAKGEGAQRPRQNTDGEQEGGVAASARPGPTQAGAVEG
jgi:hypothetical protein